MLEIRSFPFGAFILALGRALPKSLISKPTNQPTNQPILNSCHLLKRCFFLPKNGHLKITKEFLLDLALGCVEADASATLTSAPQEGRAAGTDLNWCLGSKQKAW